MDLAELLVVIGVDMEDYKRGMAQAKRQLKDFEEEGIKSISSFADSVKQKMKQAGVAIAAGLGVAAAAGIKFNADMEQAEVGFTTLLGSAEKAKSMLEELKEFGATTPFEIDGVIESSKLMLAMGFNAEQILPGMTAIGDAVSAIGGGQAELEGVTRAIGQMLTKGKVSAEEMNQLAERGIGGWDLLAESMGKSKAELMEMAQQGQLLSEEALPALLQGMSERFAGSMEAQSKTFFGMLSTLKDNIGFFLGDATAPLFEHLTEAMGGLNERIAQMSESGELDKLANDIGNALMRAVNIAVQVGTTLVNIAKGIKDNWGLISPVLYGTVAALAAMKIVGLVAAAWGAYRKAAQFAALAQQGLNAVMRANPIGLIVTAIGVLVAAVAALYNAWQNNWFGIQEKTEAVVGVILTYFTTLWSAVKTGFNGMMVAVYSILDGILNKIRPVMRVIGTIAPGFEEAFERAAAAIRDKKVQVIDDTKDLAAETAANLARLKQAGIQVRDEFAKNWQFPKAEKATKSFEETISEAEEATFSFGDAVKEADDFVWDFGSSSASTAKSIDDMSDAYRRAMKLFRFQVDIGSLDLEQQLEALQKIRDEYAKTADDIMEIELEIHRTKQEIIRDGFEFSKNWIDERKYYNELSLEEELAAWLRVSKRYDKGTEERKEAERELYRVRKELLSRALEQEEEMYEDFLERREEAELEALEKAEDDYDEYHDKRMEQLEERTKAAVDSYQAEIDALDELLRKRKDDRKEEELAKELAEQQAIYEKYRHSASREGREKAAEALEEAQRIQQEIEDEQYRQSIERQKEALEEKIERTEENAEAQKSIWEQEADDMRKKFEEDKKIIQSYYDEREDALSKHYERMEEAAKNYARENVDIHTKEQWEIIRMLENFSGEYFDKGKTFSDMLREGFISGLTGLQDAVTRANDILFPKILYPIGTSPSLAGIPGTTPQRGGAAVNSQSTTYNSPLMLIQSLEVRDDNDIRMLGEQLDKIRVNSLRSKGGR